MAGERLQAILHHIERLRRGDLHARLDPSGAEEELATIASALDQLGVALRNREELYLVAQQVAVSNLKRLDELAAELGRARVLNQEQHETIQTLSAPIIRVWDGVLMMPVLGAINGDRAARMMEALLDAVTTSRTRYAIIDLTGVRTLDPMLGEQLRRLFQAIRLLGAKGILVGIRPDVAQAMVSGGVDLAGTPTLATVREALVLCMRADHEGA